MKKILLLFAVTGLLTFTSCSDDDDKHDSDTISEVFEVTDVDFVSSGNYEITVPLNPNIYSSDMLLVYRLVPEQSGSIDVWEPIPVTKYNVSGVNGAEIDYGFNFSQADVVIYMGSNDNLANFPEYTQNQVFRIVIVPGYLSNKQSTNAHVDFSDYNAVIKAFGINDKNIKEIKLK